MNRVNAIKSIYPPLAARRFVRNPNAVMGDSIVNKHLNPINIPDSLHPLAYIFKNALIEISRLDNYNIKIDFMVQLNLIMLASTNINTPKGIKVDLVLFKSPRPGDLNYEPNKRFNVVKPEDYNTKEEYLSWLEFDEICTAFVNGAPYYITRTFLQSVMDLKNNQTFEDYFDRIGVRYRKESTYNTGVVFFEAMRSSMKDFVFDREGGPLHERIADLDAGKQLPLIMTSALEVNLFKYRGAYYLRVKKYAFQGNSNQLGVTGLLADLTINRYMEEYIAIDPLTANTLISYFTQDEERFVQEGEDLLYHILAYYPVTSNVDIMQREVNRRNKVGR